MEVINYKYTKIEGNAFDLVVREEGREQEQILPHNSLQGNEALQCRGSTAREHDW